MKKIIIAIIMCVSLLAAAPQVQAAPKALTQKEKQQYSQRTATLPASFGEENGENPAIIYAILGAIFLGSLFTYWARGGSYSPGVLEALTAD
jgi:ABC-type oligopeptide transport system substrate-binding subunit